MSVSTITPQEVATLSANGNSVELIDVRTPAEFQGLHATGAVNYPLDQLDPAAIMGGRKSDSSPLYVICQMGGRSLKACQQFVAAGFPNVVNVEGGTNSWDEQGLPVTRGDRQVIAIDRQVRITAGSLVVLGVALAAVIQPPWIGLGLAAFIGAGLVFAGLTNTCGMATMLAKMPWNQVKSPGNC